MMIYVYFVFSVRMVTTVHSSNMAIITVPREYLSTNQMKMVAFCPPSAMDLIILSPTSLVETCKEPYINKQYCIYVLWQKSISQDKCGSYSKTSREKHFNTKGESKCVRLVHVASTFSYSQSDKCDDNSKYHIYLCVSFIKN